MSIQEDHDYFRRIIEGNLRKDLKKRFESGSIFRLRPSDGKRIRVSIPQIRIPHIWWAEMGEGVGRGPGKPGDKISKPRKGKGKGGPGEGAGDGMMVDVDLEEVFKVLKEELELPDMKPKPNQTYEEIRTIYNGLSKVGPRSLLHKKRTMLAAMKRLAAMGQLNDLHNIPGLNKPVPIITPYNDDRRFRQYNEIKIPSSNAVIFFLRDGSGSMNGAKTEIVSDIAFWLNLYISKYYDKVQRVFIWHDYEAKEVSEADFFGLRDGGGTKCSTSFKMMKSIIKERFDPIKWNIYGFYFGDGENTTPDNQEISKLLKSDLGPNVVNLMGQVEIMHYKGFGDSLKEYLDSRLKKGELPHLRNTEVHSENSWSISEEERDRQVKLVLKKLLGRTEEIRSTFAASSGVKLEKI